MKAILKTLLIISLFGFTANNSFGQFSSESAFYVVKESNPSQFMTYVIETYGVESGEALLLKLHAYEAKNQVTVLYTDDFNLVMSKIETAIADADSNLEIIAYLNSRKAKIVSFKTIENQLN